jgi:predicted O-methyltransferase YrrM
VDIEQIPSAWKGHRKFANWLVRRQQPRTIVELGVDYGYSLFCLAEQGLGTVYGVDTFQGDMHSGHHADAWTALQRILRENAYDNIVILKTTFDDAAEAWCLPIDILHLDGLHTYESTRHDLNTWKRWLRESGVVIMHDTESHAGVRRVFDELDWPKYNFEPSSGLGVLCRDAGLIQAVKANRDLFHSAWNPVISHNRRDAGASS